MLARSAPSGTLMPVASPTMVCGFAPAALRPSEYTAALIQVLRARAAWVQGANVLEIGSGSGVVLAALGALGAASLCGIDIESDAVISGALLLRELGHGDNAKIHHGDMWRPVAGRRFDLIAANLPQFPMQACEITGRRPSWSSGPGEPCWIVFSKGWPHTSPSAAARLSPITGLWISSDRDRWSRRAGCRCVSLPRCWCTSPKKSST